MGDEHAIERALIRFVPRCDGRWWLVERVNDNRATVGSLDVFVR